MTKDLAPAIIAGAVSALLYFIVSLFGLGLLFLFLPTLPIFWLGLTRNFMGALHACLIAALLLALVAVPVANLILYLAFLVLPAWYIAYESMKSGSAHGRVVWFPITVIMARLMTGFAFLLLAVTLYYAGRAEGGLPALIAPDIQAAVDRFAAGFDEETAAKLKQAAPHMGFLVFSTTAWIWAGCLYLHGWVTNRELVRQKRATRPDMALSALPPPNWMISLLLLTALASLTGGASLAFWGKASMIILLFPYFLLGMALIHLHLRSLPNPYLLLFFICFLALLSVWPVLFIAGYGVIYHVRLLNKYLSAGGNSSRS